MLTAQGGKQISIESHWCLTQLRSVQLRSVGKRLSVGLLSLHLLLADAPELLSTWQPTVIKGNAAEIGAMAKSTEVSSRGVDSAGGAFENPAQVVKALARKRGKPSIR